MRLVKALEPGGAYLCVHRCHRDHVCKLRDRTVDGRTDRTRGAVNLLERGGHALKKQNGALRRNNGLLLGHFLDLGHGFAHTGDRGL
jgi:hypothetical protein